MVRRTYAPRGKTPILEAWHRKGRISAISAVTVSPVRRRPDLYFRLLPDNANAHGEDTVAFLAQLRRQIRGPMTILWDQSKIHERSRVVRAYLAKHPEIVTEDFPGYAPEANPDEGVWLHTSTTGCRTSRPRTRPSCGRGWSRSWSGSTASPICWPRSSATPRSRSGYGVVSLATLESVRKIKCRRSRGSLPPFVVRRISTNASHCLSA